jgi:cell migration-inducing and hyaluronan-binding protein
MTWLLLLVLLLLGCAPTELPVGSSPPPVTGLWSDPASWPEGRLPKQGEAVIIPKGETILLDVGSVDLTSLTIEGALVFSDNLDIALKSDWIMVHGLLQSGSVDHPHRHKVVITLIDRNPGEKVGPRGRMGDKVLGVMDGTLELHGSPRVSWTKLGASAPAGADILTLAEKVDWQVGDKIVVASSDFAFEQAEELAITGVQGRQVEVFPPLEYSHYGELQTFGGHTLNERAEVGLLSHNIVIKGADSKTGFGGHLMVMGDSTVHISNAAFTHMGQAGLLARYPVHTSTSWETPRGALMWWARASHLAK